MENHYTEDNPHPDHFYYIVGIREDNNKIIEEIYAKYFPENAVWIKRNSGTHEDAEDIFQDALLIISRKAIHDRSFVLTFPFRLYIQGVCRNLWLKELGKRKKHQKVIRKIKKEELIIDDYLGKLIIETIDGDCWLLLLERTLNQLRDRCIKVLTLYREGKNGTEIAQIMDINENTVYQLGYTCKNKWRQKIIKDSEFPNCKPS